MILESLITCPALRHGKNGKHADPRQLLAALLELGATSDLSPKSAIMRRACVYCGQNPEPPQETLRSTPPCASPVLPQTSCGVSAGAIVTLWPSR
jgi:hypothetical protein